ncbi:hypothetical protein SVAN01_05365 [Stagonosporopsis vannaccii]|nr:hypothetical protein SVAN01_05365 [Stagonosporopsis vannaccii]
MTQPSESTQILAPPEEEAAVSLEQLPEELISRVMSFLRPQSSLAAAAMASRKLNRIVTPLIYTAVSLTVTRPGKTVSTAVEDPMASDQAAAVAPLINVTYNIITLDKCNISHFINTMMCRPDLRLHVKYVELLRQDSGCFTRAYVTRHAQWPRAGGLALESYSVFDREATRVIVITDPAKEAVQVLLRMLPNIHYLDCSGYHTDIPTHAVLSGIGSRAVFQTSQHNLQQLRHFKLDCKTESFFAQLWPIFTLPNLETLCLLGLQLSPLTSSAALEKFDRWTQIVPSGSITKVELLGTMHASSVLGDANLVSILAPMGMLFGTCKQLKSLTVTTVSPDLQQILQDTFVQFFSTIENLDIREID